jgi:hypothetical protein
MCFTGEMSGGFSMAGLFAAWWVYNKTNNTELASGVFFFFTMEFLQFIQYLYLASGLTDPVCDSIINQVLTLLGFLHICLQPYFCHVINASLTKSCKYKDRYKIIKRLVLIGGMLLFLRWPLSFIPSLNTMDVSINAATGLGKSTEWLRGDTLCTFKTESMYHLGWSVPMADPSYYVMSASIHSFCMFAPFLALYEKKGMVIQGVFLFATGPGMAAMISPNLMEQASIWCFFSVAQICIMLFLIRETLILQWGKGQISVMSADAGDKQKSSKGKGEGCRDFKNCEFCQTGYYAKKKK